MDFLTHLHVVVKHIVKLTKANNNMQMGQKRREKQTVLIKIVATVNFRLHHVNYQILHGVLSHETQALKN